MNLVILDNDSVTLENLLSCVDGTVYERIVSITPDHLLRRLIGVVVAIAHL